DQEAARVPCVERRGVERGEDPGDAEAHVDDVRPVRVAGYAGNRQTGGPADGTDEVGDRCVHAGSVEHFHGQDLDGGPHAYTDDPVTVVAPGGGDARDVRPVLRMSVRNAGVGTGIVVVEVPAR